MSTKNERSEIIDSLTTEFGVVSGLYFTAYEGITVEKFNTIRAELRKVGAKYLVAKNTLTRIALERIGIEGIAPSLKGPTGIIVTNDAAGSAKVLKKFNNDNKDLLAIKVAYVDGTVFTKTDAEKLADLPSREALYSMFLSCLNAPITKFAGTLSGILTNFVRTVDAVRVKKEEA